MDMLRDRILDLVNEDLSDQEILRILKEEGNTEIDLVTVIRFLLCD